MFHLSGNPAYAQLCLGANQAFLHFLVVLLKIQKSVIMQLCYLLYLLKLVKQMIPLLLMWSLNAEPGGDSWSAMAFCCRNSASFFKDKRLSLSLNRGFVQFLLCSILSFTDQSLLFKYLLFHLKFKFFTFWLPNESLTLSTLN